MKKFTLVFAIVLASVPAVYAQGSSYRLDNFDFASGVRIATPPPAPATEKITRRKRSLSTRTYNHSPADLPLNRLTSMEIGNGLSGYSTGSAEIDSYIIDSGKRNSVDPLLLYAIMHQESSFKSRAMSHKGARGLMQLMPGTAARFGVKSIWDPRQNIEGGTRYMRFLLDYFEGDVRLALAGYNAGEGAVIKYGYRIPPYSETQEYVRRISKRYSLIRDPMTARTANTATREQIALAQTKESAPLSLYERSVFAVRLPDGRLQLVTQ